MWRYPPSTSYRRPTERKFYVWQDRHIDHAGFAARNGWERHPWRWLCTFCEPPASGIRTRRGAWKDILTISMPGHFQRRHAHHEHVRRTHGG